MIKVVLNDKVNYVLYEDTQLNTAIEMFKYDDLDAYKWAQESIAELSMKNIVKGTANKKFSPSDNVTRAEFAAMLVRAFDITIDESNPVVFGDVSIEDWFYDVVNIAASVGLLKGDENGNFNPTIKMLQRLAAGMNRHIELKFVPNT